SDAASSKEVFGWLDAVDGVGRAGAAAKDSVDALIRLVEQAKKGYANVERRPFFADYRERLAAALGRIGPDAAAAVSALDEWKSKGDETIRVPAAQALRRIRAKK